MVRIASYSLTTAGRELHRIGFAKDYRAGAAHHGNWRRIATHSHPIVNRRVLRGRIICCIDHILYAPRDAMQRAFALSLVQLARAADGVISVQPEPRLHVRIARRDPSQAGAYKLLTGQLSSRNKR